MVRGPTLSSHAFRRTRYPKGPRIFLTALPWSPMHALQHGAKA
jgi:hypothetical protein